MLTRRGRPTAAWRRPLLSLRWGDSVDRDQALPLRRDRADRRRGHGCRVPGARRAPGAGRGGEGAARRGAGGRRGPEAVPAGSARLIEAQSSEHRGGPRLRFSGRRGLLGIGAGARGDAGGAGGAGSAFGEGDRAAWGAAGGGALGGAQAGGAAPGHQACESSGDAGGAAEDSGFWVGAAGSGGGRGGGDGDGDGGGGGDGAVHVAGAVARGGAGRAGGHLGGGRGAVRALDGASRVRAGAASAVDRGDSGGGGGAASGGWGEGIAGAGADRAEVFGEGPGGPLSVGPGAGGGSEAAVGSLCGVTDPPPSGEAPGGAIGTRRRRGGRSLRPRRAPVRAQRRRGPDPYVRGPSADHALAGGAAAGESLRRPLAGVLRRRNDRRADHAACADLHAQGDLAHVGHAVQGHEEVRLGDRP